MQRMKNNDAPLIVGFSEDHIKRLEQIGFDWKARKYYSFEKRFQELKAYKTKHGHCNVRTKIGDDQPLGRWCSLVRQSLTKIKNNEATIVQGLSEDRIRRLEHFGALILWPRNNLLKNTSRNSKPTRQSTDTAT